MKRFLGIRAHILFGAVALFGAGAARAGVIETPPVCVIPADAPEALFFFLIDELGELLPIEEEEACAKITQGALKACHKHVSDAASCWASAFKVVGKAAKVGCPTTGEAEEDCKSFFENEAANAAAGVAESAASGHAVCDSEFADAIFDDCMGFLKK